MSTLTYELSFNVAVSKQDLTGSCRIKIRLPLDPFLYLKALKVKDAPPEVMPQGKFQDQKYFQIDQ